MREVKNTRRDTEFLLALARKFEAVDGQTLTLEDVKTLINQAAFDAKAPRINTDQGKKSQKGDDGIFYKALSSIRADLIALDLIDFLSIGNGKKGRKGYPIKCNRHAFQKALWDKEKGKYIDTRAFLLECGITKTKEKTKKKNTKSNPIIVKEKTIEVVTPVISPVENSEKHIESACVEQIQPQVNPTVNNVPAVLPPTLKVVGRINLDTIRPSRPNKEKKEKREAREQEKFQRTRSMEEFRRIMGIAIPLYFFGGERLLDDLYYSVNYNTFYSEYPTLKDNSEDKNISNFRLLLTSGYDDFFLVSRNEMGKLRVRFKKEDSWERIKNLYRDRVVTAQFAVRRDIGYTWLDEDYLKPYVKSVININGEPSVVTLSWRLTIEGLQEFMINAADALDQSRIISYRVNNQNDISDINSCDKLLSWLFEIDDYTRQYGLLKNSVEACSSLGVDFKESLSLGGTTSPEINNFIYYLVEKTF